MVPPFTLFRFSEDKTGVMVLPFMHCVPASL